MPKKYAPKTWAETTTLHKVAIVGTVLFFGFALSTCFMPEVETAAPSTSSKASLPTVAPTTAAAPIDNKASVLKYYADTLEIARPCDTASNDYGEAMIRFSEQKISSAVAKSSAEKAKAACVVSQSSMFALKPPSGLSPAITARAESAEERCQTATAAKIEGIDIGLRILDGDQDTTSLDAFVANAAAVEQTMSACVADLISYADATGLTSTELIAAAPK